MNGSYFQVGVVTGALGLKGEIKVFPTTDEPERFNLLAQVFIERQGVMTPWDIEKVRFHKHMTVLKLRGVEDVDAAEKLRGVSLMIPPDMALPLEEGQFYQRDLVGMDVRLENGEVLGILTRVIETGANDVYAIEKTAGGELLIPAIKQCILAVDVAGKRMTVSLLPGLLEL